MPEYGITFGGLSVVIQYGNSEVLEFLNLLFHDLHCPIADDCEMVLEISQAGASGQYALSTDVEEIGRDSLGVKFAAVLYDSVIFNLLKKNRLGVAFHAGAVACREKVILLPGKSGSGKSTMAAWLAAQGFSYLTDELILVPEKDPDTIIPFTRPVCIKTGSAAEVKQFFSGAKGSGMLEDKDGIIVAHQLLNPIFSPIRSSPSLILFPVYQFSSPLNIQRITGAQACTLLMECDVNARNLPDHGFKQIVRIARSIPAYRVTYGSFQGLDDALAELFAELQWS